MKWRTDSDLPRLCKMRGEIVIHRPGTVRTQSTVSEPNDKFMTLDLCSGDEQCRLSHTAAITALHPVTVNSHCLLLLLIQTAGGWLLVPYSILAHCHCWWSGSSSSSSSSSSSHLVDLPVSQWLTDYLTGKTTRSKYTSGQRHGTFDWKPETLIES